MESTIRNQQSAIHDLIVFAYNRSPAFRARMDAAKLTPSDITDESDLAKIPILRKEDLIALQKSAPDLGGMTTQPLSTFKRIFQSPGPIHDPEGNEPDQWRWKSAFSTAGIGGNDIAINCFGYHLTPAAVMFEEGARAVGCAVVPAGIGSQAQQIDAIEALGVSVYAGLPSYLKGLLDKAKESGRDLSKWKLRKAIFSAEPLPPSLRKWLLDEHGIESFNVYGTAECGNLGYEDSSHNGFIVPDDCVIQICDINNGQPVKNGETGEVVVTLYRRDYILVRFGVGDLSARTADGTRLVGWLGRSGDSVKVRGIFVHPRHCAEAIARVKGVAQSQVVITRHEHRDELTARIVPSADANANEVSEHVAQALQDALKLRCNVEAVATLPTDAKAFVDERKWD